MTDQGPDQPPQVPERPQTGTAPKVTVTDTGGHEAEKKDKKDKTEKKDKK